MSSLSSKIMSNNPPKKRFQTKVSAINTIVMITISFKEKPYSKSLFLNFQKKVKPNFKKSVFHNMLVNHKSLDHITLIPKTREIKIEQMKTLLHIPRLLLIHGCPVLYVLVNYLSTLFLPRRQCKQYLVK